MSYSFDTKAAMVVGVNSAIILKNLAFWVKKNEANEVHFHEGNYWTYNSRKAFQKLFPFWTDSIIKTALKKLEDGGYILVRQFNKDKMNHTNWYTITEKGWLLVPSKEPASTIGQESPIEETKITNRLVKNQFPTNNTDIKQADIKQDTRARPRAKAAPKAQPSHVSCPFYNPSQDLVAAWAGFEEMRRKMKKPLTQRAGDLIAKKVQKLAEGDEATQAAILDQSVERGWLGVFPLKCDTEHTEAYHVDAPRPRMTYGEPSANDLYEQAKAMLEGGTPL